MLGESTLRGANLVKKMYYSKNKFNIILGVVFTSIFYVAFWVQQIKWIFETRSLTQFMLPFKGEYFFKIIIIIHTLSLV
jgi:hypothetical protein